MDDLIARLDALLTPEQLATMRTREESAARIAHLQALIASAVRLPSLPEMARQIQVLTEAVTTLQQTVTRLEQQCEALRQRELLRLWDTTD